MKTSEQINELAVALANAQAEIKNPKADATNPHFKSRYADLASVRAAIQEPLAKNGLSIAQLPVTMGANIGLVTRLMHTSGQWIEAECELIVEKPTMQGLGSAITYMKRYALNALLGLAEDDDDGNEATKFAVKKAQAINEKVQSPSAQTELKVQPKPNAAVSTPTCERCNSVMLKSKSGLSWYCPKFLDVKNGEHSKIMV